MSFSGGTKATAGTGYPIAWDPRKKPHTAVYLGRRGGKGQSDDYDNVLRSNTEGRSTELTQNEIDNYVKGSAGVDAESYMTVNSPHPNMPATYRDSLNI